MSYVPSRRDEVLYHIPLDINFYIRDLPIRPKGGQVSSIRAEGYIEPADKNPGCHNYRQLWKATTKLKRWRECWEMRHK